MPTSTFGSIVTQERLARAILPAALVALLICFDFVDDHLLSTANLVNILQQTSYLAIFAMAQTVVIVTRGFDLALGPTVSLVSVAVALSISGVLAFDSGSILIVCAALLLGLLVGSLVGMFNGVVIAFLGVSPFVTTLGSLNIATGIATTLSGGRPVQGVPNLFSSLLYSGTIFGVPVAIVIATFTGVVLHLVFNRTVFGRSLYLVGTNTRAAAVAGVPTRRILVCAYVLSSALAALGAMMLTARTGSGEPNLGGSLSLQAIAAAVIGGASLMGGVGGVGTAVTGALFVTVLSNGMNLIQINGYVQMIVLGLIVIAGVALDRVKTSNGD